MATPFCGGAMGLRCDAGFAVEGALLGDDELKWPLGSSGSTAVCGGGCERGVSCAEPSKHRASVHRAGAFQSSARAWHVGSSTRSMWYVSAVNERPRKHKHAA